MTPVPLKRRHQAGFSLLEVMMVMFILVILLGAVFSVVRATIQLSNEMSETQLAESRVNGFAQFCERTLRNLPASAVVRHRVKQKGNHYLSQLTFKGAPGAFSTQGTGGNEVIVLESEEQVDGYLTVSLRSMTAAQALAWEKGDGRVGRRLKLLEDVANFEWRFYRVQSGEWEPVWNERLELYPLGVITANPAQDDPSGGVPPPLPGQPGAGLNTAPVIPRKQRPQLMELRLTMAASPTQRWTFWVPPAETPSGGSSPTPPVTPPPGTPLDPAPDPIPAPAPEPPP
ncbi:prepilin-type N-terminal cleavage/methylation domain-containing protein [Verrucomicrobium sp. BvORR106]|uniref:prepilin-type N-terminal cleavage/methylation domain-containing protein n=1 Tax=Verrucomicrobium sp. BvORR106 TaxID=1403819 RepID=UPI00056EF81E|nr:prepilin-type N-terminal cleavage/methylation domain-containing protein [Verrucomicrobium sp. BvORR106]